MRTSSGSARSVGGVVGPEEGFIAMDTRPAPRPRTTSSLRHSAPGLHSTTTSVASTVVSAPLHVRRAKRMDEPTDPDMPSTLSRPPLCATTRAIRNGSPDSLSAYQIAPPTRTTSSPKNASAARHTRRRRRGGGFGCGVSLICQKARPTEKCTRTARAS